MSTQQDLLEPEEPDNSADSDDLLRCRHGVVFTEPCEECEEEQEKEG